MQVFANLNPGDLHGDNMQKNDYSYLRRIPRHPRNYICRSSRRTIPNPSPATGTTPEDKLPDDQAERIVGDYPLDEFGEIHGTPDVGEI